MRRRTLHAVAICFWALCAATAPSAVRAQVTFASPPTNAGIEPAANLEAQAVAEALDRGGELETERRWSEALSWYEEALRRHPQHPKLEERLHLTRMHYDLGLRYGDPAFRDQLFKLSRSKLLELYDEVLIKIQTHYVEPPRWQSLVDNGTASVMEALLDATFLETHLSSVPQARVEEFRRALRDRLYGSKTETRQAAVNLASFAAQMAREQLGLSENAVIFEYVAGAAGALDPYSAYLSTGKLNEVYSQIEGNFVGLGVELKANDGALLIVKVFPGGPADRAGIRAGDRIVGVGARSTQELSTDQAANLLQGAEGTNVEVSVETPGAPPRRLVVRREQIEVPSVDNVHIVDRASGIGYLRMTCFQKTTSRDLDAALWKLHAEGMQSLIIDLRGNPGGLLNISVDVVDKFVNDGVIVATRGRNPTEDYSYTAHRPGTWQVPLVVLIDGDSASASEIFAGAIRDHRRGTIVGQRSYGKGSVQGIYPLSTLNAGIRLTTAKFYSPDGHAFSRVGVSPDVVVQQTARPTSEGVVPSPAEVSDSALDAAVNVARNQLVQR